MIRLLLTLALMCENVNAAPQDNKADRRAVDTTDALTGRSSAPLPNTSGPDGAAPFTLSHPLCTTGFMLAQRIDTRDNFGIIVKREWKMTGCAKGKIIYGGKV